MCKCTPEIRTPFCGKGDCQWPMSAGVKTATETIIEDEAMRQQKRLDDFKRELTGIINKYCMENKSNTPDFILADYLIRCLAAFDFSCKRRSDWHKDRE